MTLMLMLQQVHNISILATLFLCAVSSAPPPILVVSRVSPSTTATPTGDPNFEVIRPFSNRYIRDEFSNPFLMCDEWGIPHKELGHPAVDPGPPAVTGKRHVGWHPHRGFDIVSVIKEGRGSHADSMGNVEVVRPGGIQWMRTGSGVEHAEGGGNPVNADKHGFQLWINLPSYMKMNEPSYGTVQPENVPQVNNTGNRGGLIRYLSGAFQHSASFRDRDDFSIIDIELPANSTEIISIPIQFDRIIAYAYRGSGMIADRNVSTQNTAIVTVGAIETSAAADADVGAASVATLNLRAGKKGYAVLLFAAKHMREPIAWRGPIVMNQQSEIKTAYRELRAGTFLKKRVGYDYRAIAQTK